MTYDYDAAGNLRTIKENGTTTLATYAYDSLGRRTGLTRGNGVATSYNYDAVSRLTGLGLDLAGTSGDLALGMSYNPAGQIKATTRSNDAYGWTGAVNVNRGYTANGLNQFTASGSVTLGYDARGNLTSSGSDTYAYDSENRLKSRNNGTTLYYDPLGRLTEYDTSVSTRFVYDGGNIAAEVSNPGGAIVKRYVYGAGADELLAEYDGSGTKTYPIADERGSVVARTNASGALTAANSYDEYGIPGASNSGRFGYTGQAWLPELGLQYSKARMYSPSLGRFMQTDPIGYGDGLNWYNYVKSDPVNRTDPSGLYCSITNHWTDVYKGFSDGHVEYVGKEPGSEYVTISGDCSSGPGSGGSIGGNGAPNEGPIGPDVVVTATKNQTRPPKKYQAPGNQINNPCPHRDPFGMCDSYGYPSGTPEILRLERCDRASIGMDPIGAAMGTPQGTAEISGGLGIAGGIIRGTVGKSLGLFGAFLGAIQFGSAVESSSWRCGQ